MADAKLPFNTSKKSDFIKKCREPWEKAVCKLITSQFYKEVETRNNLKSSLLGGIKGKELQEKLKNLTPEEAEYIEATVNQITIGVLYHD